MEHTEAVHKAKAVTVAAYSKALMALRAMASKAIKARVREAMAIRISTAHKATMVLSNMATRALMASKAISTRVHGARAVLHTARARWETRATMAHITREDTMVALPTR